MTTGVPLLGAKTAQIYFNILYVPQTCGFVNLFLQRINVLTPFQQTLYEKFIDILYIICYHDLNGALAQLGAHNTGSVGVRGSNPLCSTRKKVPFVYRQR